MKGLIIRSSDLTRYGRGFYVLKTTEDDEESLHEAAGQLSMGEVSNGTELTFVPLPTEIGVGFTFFVDRHPREGGLGNRRISQRKIIVSN